MAIGDGYAVNLGTGTATRQPSSGVFATVHSVQKEGANDAVHLTDGSATTEVWATSVVTHQDARGASGSGRQRSYGMSIKIGNGIYIQKGGTTDLIRISGVQVDA